MLREKLYEEVVLSLAQRGFETKSFVDMNSCFDIIARKQGLVLILKVLTNIDALRPEHAQELHKLAHAFNASPLIVGERSKVQELLPSVLYERYDLPVLSLHGFISLLDQQLPMEKSFKGKSVAVLDAQKLREEREASEMTLKELSEKAHISIESLHRYEKGAPASMEVAEKLEKILHTKIIQGINVFELPEVPAKLEDKAEIPYNSALEQLHELGLKLSVFAHAPLTAAGKEQPLLISQSDSDSVLKRKAFLLSKTRSIVHQPGMIITKHSKHVRVENIPVVQEEELSTFSSVEDIMHALREKKYAHKKNQQK